MSGFSSNNKDHLMKLFIPCIFAHTCFEYVMINLHLSIRIIVEEGVKKKSEAGWKFSILTC